MNYNRLKENLFKKADEFKEKSNNNDSGFGALMDAAVSISLTVVAIEIGKEVHRNK